MINLIRNNKNLRNLLIIIALLLIITNIDKTVLGATVTPEKKAICEAVDLQTPLFDETNYNICRVKKCGVQFDYVRLNEAFCVACVQDQKIALGSPQGCCSGYGEKVGEENDKPIYLCVPQTGKVSQIEGGVGNLVNEITGLGLNTKSAAYLGLGVILLIAVIIISAL